MNNPLLQSLFDNEERRPLTVTELNEEVKDALERKFSNVWLEAEIADFSEPSSGHWYFTLHDGKSRIRAACFKGTNWRIRFRPFNGIQVRVRGKVSVYAVRGEYQLLVDSLEPVGDGALRVAFEQVKARLRDEGLFDARHKRPLPFLPKRVGVVTSATGAAIFDIINVISRRTRTVDIVLIPAVVQGETAPESVRAGILLANDYNERCRENERLDVLIVGRGGGSAEDLAAFNEERLARTIFESGIPVISAVGHEIDVSISDLVADLRAPTPSAAAELVAQHEDDLSNKIREFESRARRLIELRLSSARQMLRVAQEAPVFRLFPEKVARYREINAALNEELSSRIAEKLGVLEKSLWTLRHRLSPVKLSADVRARKLRLGHLKQRNSAAVQKANNRFTDQLMTQAAKLHALSPLGVLERGYSITRTESGSVVTNSSAVSEGDKLSIILSRGKLEAEVISTERAEDDDSKVF